MFLKISGSSRPDVFCEKGVLKNFAKFRGRHLRQSLFFNKIAGSARNFIKKETEFCEMSKNTFFYRTPLVAAPGFRNILNEKEAPTEMFFCKFAIFFNSFLIEYLRWLLLFFLKVTLKRCPCLVSFVYTSLYSSTLAYNRPDLSSGSSILI